ncbi:MAG: hypothetical protein WCJ56_13565 [bacterium]
MQTNTGVWRIIASLAFMFMMLPVMAAHFTGSSISLPGSIPVPAQAPPVIPLPSTPNFVQRSPLGPKDDIPTRFYKEQWLDGFLLGASYLEVMNKKYIFGDIVMDGNGGVPTQIGPSLNGIDDILKLFKFIEVPPTDYTVLPLPIAGATNTTVATDPLAPPAAIVVPPMPTPPTFPNPLLEKYVFAYDRQNDDGTVHWKTYVLFRNGRVVGVSSRLKQEAITADMKLNATMTSAGEVKLNEGSYIHVHKLPKERLWLQNDIGFNYQMAEMATRRNMGWPDLPSGMTSSIDSWYYLYYNKWNFALTIDAQTRMVIGVSIGDKLMVVPAPADAGNSGSGATGTTKSGAGSPELDMSDLTVTVSGTIKALPEPVSKGNN